MKLRDRNAAADTNHTARTTTMRAIVQDRYGTADELRPARITRPVIADHEVLLRVQAAGLDRGTWHLMTGRPYLMRIIGFGYARPKSRVPGLDVAGTVVAVGSAVTKFAPGDEVFGVSRGSFAEYSAAHEDKLHHKPANASFEQVATVGISGGTALQALEAGHLQPGQRLLIIGASGGVGSYAVQLAKITGADVTGVCSTDKLDLVAGLGADRVVDYTREDFADGTNRYDLIIDIGGNSSLSRLRLALTPTGTAIIVGGEGKGNLTGGIDRQLRATILGWFVGQRLTSLATKQRPRDRQTFAEHITAGALTPSVDRTYPPHQAATAMRHLEAGKARGKIAITIDSQFNPPDKPNQEDSNAPLTRRDRRHPQPQNALGSEPMARRPKTPALVTWRRHKPVKPTTATAANQPVGDPVHGSRVRPPRLSHGELMGFVAAVRQNLRPTGRAGPDLGVAAGPKVQTQVTKP